MVAMTAQKPFRINSINVKCLSTIEPGEQVFILHLDQISLMFLYYVQLFLLRNFFMMPSDLQTFIRVVWCRQYNRQLVRDVRLQQLAV